MDSYELNKIAGGFLLAALIIIGINHLGDALVHPEALAKNAYVVQGVQTASATTPAAAAPVDAGPSFDVLMASASVTRGEAVFKKCSTCHTAEKGGKTKVGPDLYNTVGHKVGGHEGFSYSDAIAKHGGTWTFDLLDKWLTSPREFAPGTKMTFAGLSKTEDRANVIAYLNSMTDKPLPLPKAPAAEPAKK